jgi:hypothetical protein
MRESVADALDAGQVSSRCQSLGGGLLAALCHDKSLAVGDDRVLEAAG